ncbi:MAG: malto-oligosyltrehalose synthase [Candidatus Tectomicrobia bacterium]|nr:malto-oligosyltrehalose synthase [Candidatus Tectomicrobia bacterium]
MTIAAPVPDATYRLQLNRRFPFRRASALVGYLDELGVSHCYTSPFLTARPGSLHGYDITDPGAINPEVGTERELASFARGLRRRGMGILMDVVPNHVCVADPANRWWNDLLENGPASPYACFFDVDWDSPDAPRAGKVLLPFLGQDCRRALKSGEIRVSRRGGAFFAEYSTLRFPLDPATWPHILLPALDRLRGRAKDSPGASGLQSLIAAVRRLPPRTDAAPRKVKERQRVNALVKDRLSLLVEADGGVRRAVREALAELNGDALGRLDALLSGQAYRLSRWRAAVEEINYRRFFDITELAAVRVEDPRVFAAVHRLVFHWIQRGWVTGLRIDHVDGLLDPEKYLGDLQQACLSAGRGAGASAGPSVPRRPRRPCYVVVEKILAHDEELRRRWPVHGTTGYEFLNLLNGIFVDARRERAFRGLYARLTGRRESFEDVVYESKRRVLRESLSAELRRLGRSLERIRGPRRRARGFTRGELEEALGGVIACFPVYRSYLRGVEPSAGGEDRRVLAWAIREAGRRNREIAKGVFDFIGAVLLGKGPGGLDGGRRAERRDFILRFQQLTTPAMAKGFEDTALYRHFPLASLNEVGGGPGRFGVAIDDFHRKNRDRLKKWPHGLSATSTHDTNRGEDVRARINVLSEIPGEWERAVRRWRRLNEKQKARLKGRAAPDAHEEYLLYQTLVGAWPLAPGDAAAPSDFPRRVQDYMTKALREAKVHTGWLQPDEDYERGVQEFVRRVLRPAPENRFLADFAAFQHPVARAGVFNSLSQTLLKIASPGVPDFYQGAELWDFSLVDPDNRRPVDYGRRKRLLASLRAEGPAGPGALLARLMRRPEDGRIKLFVTSRALGFRRRERGLFLHGRYLPLRVRGGRERHVCAFARTDGEKAAIAAAGRFFLSLGAADRPPVGRETWGDAVVSLGGPLAPGAYRDVFTQQEVRARRRGGAWVLPLDEVFSHLPVALLERVS